jgi:Putative transposase
MKTHFLDDLRNCSISQSKFAVGSETSISTARVCAEAAASFKKHKRTLAGQLTPLQSPAEFAALLRAAAHRNWVVYAKRPFAGPAQVLTYLSLYTHRIAIANSRLLAMADVGLPSDGETTPMSTRLGP